MRKTLFSALALATIVAACTSGSPTAPSTVTIETPTPTTTTTSIPPTTTTTTVTTTLPAPTTTIPPPPATTRVYVSLGQVPPNVPSSLTLIHTPTTGRITGFYLTPSGGGGHIGGSLNGNLDAGSYSGNLTAETPECIAEREFSGSVDPQFLRWSGGTTLRDCKGSPLAFNSLVMVATAGPPPNTTIAPTTSSVPQQCAFSLSTDTITIDAAGGQRPVGISTSGGCAWQVQNFAPWITVQPPAGSGSATINISIDQNPGAPRSATVIIGGMPLTVNQGLPSTTTTTTIPTLADLLPVTPTTNFCRTGTFGGAWSLTVDVRNQGNGASGSSFTRVFFDNGSGSTTFVDRLTAGLPSATSTSLAFAIPASCQIVNCAILINTDVTFTVQESNETNNNVAATCDLRAPGPVQ